MGLRLRWVLLVMAVAALASCAVPDQAASGSKLVYGLTLAPSGLDPHLDVSSELGIPLNSVYDTLIFRTQSGDLVPMLAESWEISEDGLEYVFRLRQGIRFHDGTPFTAAAVKRTLDRIADPENGSRRAVTLLGPYVGSTVRDEHTIVVELSEPFAPLLDSFSQVYLAPASPAALDKWGAEYQFHQVGTGPFALKEYVPKDHVTLVRYDDYVRIPGTYARDALPAVTEVEFRFLVEPAIRLPALESGDADIVGEIPSQDASRIERDDDLELVPVPIPGLPLVGFLNTQRSPTDDVRVREALLLATDQGQIVQAVFGGYSPVATGALSRNHPDYAVGAAERTGAPDLVAAGALLDEAGWKSGPDGMRVRDGEPLALRAYVMGWGLVPEVGQVLQSQWRVLGVDLQLEEVTFAAALAAVAANEHNLIFWSEPGTDADLLTSFFHSGPSGQRNWSQVQSPELDALLDAARQAPDTVERRRLYAMVQDLIMEQALIVPIRDYVNLNGMRSCVGSLSFDSRGWFPNLHDLELNTACR